MYQSIQTDALTTPAQVRPRRRVETIMGYDGPERCAALPAPLLASITPARLLEWLLAFWYLVVALAVLGR
ncbi:MAG: hypothetical protein MO852_16665 [Candidatus Devosia euplotis]|nr:hypothetical protein [Candidatus Devosia euplotis]